MPRVTIENLKFVDELIEAGKVKPVIDRCYTLEQVAEAHIYAETGHAKGKIIVTVADKSYVQDIDET